MVEKSLRVSKVRERWKIILSFLGIQAFFALMIFSFSMGGQTVFAVLVAIPPLAAASTMSRKGLFFIFYFMCVLFVVGQRTVYLGHYVRIVPAETLLLLLSVLCIGYKSPSTVLKQGRIPIVAIVLFFGALFSIYTNSRWNYYGYGDLNLSIGYAKMMWLAIPAFFVCGRLIQRLEQYQNILTLISMGCFFLSLLALAEYYHLPFMHYFGGFVQQNSKALSGAEGFHRLGATFWGGPMLAGYMTMIFPLILAHMFNSKTTITRLILGATLLGAFLTIYYSGHRGLWVTFMVSIACFFYLKGLRGVFILLIVGAIGIQFVPDIAKERMQSIYGESEDSSSKKRIQRAEFAWEMIKDDPIIGHGWGASGLVHSDILQIWADAGAGTVGPLILIFFQTFGRLWGHMRRARDKIDREYYSGFFASVLSAFIILWHQAWLNLPEQYLPFWVVMALAFHFPNSCLNELRIKALNFTVKLQKENVQNV